MCNLGRASFIFTLTVAIPRSACPTRPVCAHLYENKSASRTFVLHARQPSTRRIIESVASAAQSGEREEEEGRRRMRHGCIGVGQ